MNGSKLRTAILGGTFDPVHIGHLLIAQDVLHDLHYERVLFVPARLPPHKDHSPRASAEERLAMLALAVGDNPSFALEAFEIGRDTVSFTIHTVRHLLDSGELQGRPGLIIGEDLVAGFRGWREADEIERLTDIILVRRPGHAVDADASEAPVRFERRHCRLENLQVAVSSTDVRERIRHGRPFRYLVPESVYRYIEANRLYR